MTKSDYTVGIIGKGDLLLKISAMCSQSGHKYLVTIFTKHLSTKFKQYKNIIRIITDRVSITKRKLTL